MFRRKLPHNNTPIVQLALFKNQPSIKDIPNTPVAKQAGRVKKNPELGQRVSGILKGRFGPHSEELLKTLDNTAKVEWRNEYVKKITDEMAAIVRGAKGGLGNDRRKELNALSGDLVEKCTYAPGISKIRTQTSVLTRLDYMLELAGAGETQKLKKYFEELVEKSGKMTSARALLDDDGVINALMLVREF